MIEIEINNIKKNYGLKSVLNGASFEVKTGERISLIGENGSGKSTIFKIINGDEKEDSGNVNIKKESTIGFLKQIYNEEKENIIVEDYLKRSFKQYVDIEKKLKQFESLMTDDTANIEQILMKYGNLQEKYIVMRWL